MKYSHMVLSATLVFLWVVTIWVFSVTVNSYDYIKGEMERLPTCLPEDNHFRITEEPEILDNAPLFTDEEVEYLQNR